MHIRFVKLTIIKMIIITSMACDIMTVVSIPDASVDYLQYTNILIYLYFK